MKCRGDEHRDDRDQEQGSIELCRSSLDGLLGKSDTTSEEAPVRSERLATGHCQMEGGE